MINPMKIKTAEALRSMGMTIKNTQLYLKQNFGKELSIKYYRNFFIKPIGAFEKYQKKLLSQKRFEYEDCWDAALLSFIYWQKQGKRVYIVYNDSPHFYTVIEKNIYFDPVAKEQMDVNPIGWIEDAKFHWRYKEDLRFYNLSELNRFFIQSRTMTNLIDQSANFICNIAKGLFE